MYKFWHFDHSRIAYSSAVNTRSQILTLEAYYCLFHDDSTINIVVVIIIIIIIIALANYFTINSTIHLYDRSTQVRENLHLAGGKEL